MSAVFVKGSRAKGGRAMNRKSQLACVAIAVAASLGLAAHPAGAAEELGWIHSVSAVAKTITVGNATGQNGEVYHVTDQTQLSGPDGALSLSQLPALADGTAEDFVMVSYEATTSGNVLYWLTLSPPLDQ